jgi:hypothetical protein
MLAEMVATYGGIPRGREIGKEYSIGDAILSAYRECLFVQIGFSNVWYLQPS